MQSTKSQIQKPVALRVIFVLNALMTILPFIFYYVFVTNDLSLGDYDLMWMVYTGLAYIASFIPLVYFMHNRIILGARAIFLVNILIGIPAGAYIGIVIALISLGLSLFNAKVRTYFYA